MTNVIDSLIALRNTNQKKRIMVSFRLFLDHFERIKNPKGELISESCFTETNRQIKMKTLKVAAASDDTSKSGSCT
jgi:hypothetical protein